MANDDDAPTATERAPVKTEYLTDQDVGNQVWATLRAFEGEVLTLRVQQVGEGAADNAKVPGTTRTYAERRAEITAKIDRLKRDFAPFMDQVDKLRDQQREQAAAQAG